MNSSKRVLAQLTIVLVSLAVWSQDSGSANIAGHIQTQGGSTLSVRLYSPKSTQQSSSQGDGERLLYQKVVSTQDHQPLEIVLDATMGATVLKKKNWQPSDMASDPTSGVFVLDRRGGVSRIAVGQKQADNMELLFTLSPSFQGLAIAAASDRVYVVAGSQLGCSLFRYTLSDRSLTSQIMAAKEYCGGVATDGNSVYITFPDKSEIGVLSNWTASSISRWSVVGAESLGSMTFDRLGNRLVVADHAGRAFVISVQNGASQAIASNLGYVNSIAASKEHLLFASGTVVLSLARADNHPENAPSSLRSLSGGHIVGVAVDGGDNVWYADYEKELVKGGLPLN